MTNERDTKTSRRGSSPPQNAEQILNDWLKRPRSSGITPGTVIPDEKLSQEEEKQSGITPL